MRIALLLDASLFKVPFLFADDSQSDTIHDEFVQRVVEETKKMVIGDPLDPKTDHGPQNHKAHLEKLLDYVKRGTITFMVSLLAIGIEEGASLVLGGRRVEDKKGYFFFPTILTDVTDDNFAAREESFGPIMIISKFNGSNISEVVKRANATEFGLASGVFTNNINKALVVVR